MNGGLGPAIDELAMLDPATLPDDELHELVVDLVREDSRLAAARARFVAAWDARRTWADNGSKAATARLMLEASASATTARRELRRARGLRDMPGTASALVEGKLSMDHADLLMAVKHPEIEHLFARDEGILLDQIKTLRHPDAQRCVRYWLNLAENEIGKAPCDRDRAGRHFSGVRSFRGNVVFDGMLDAIAGSIPMKELARLERAEFEADWAEARSAHGERAIESHLPRTAAQRRADAFVEMARRSAAMDPNAVMPRPLFTVLVGYDSFSKTCELSCGTVVTPSQLVPHLAEADIERIVFDGPSRVIEVGVRQRFFTGALRRAIQVRDRRCTHPSGCDVPAEQCEIDHEVPYGEGGLTTQTNARCACRRHNRQRNTTPDPPGWSGKYDEVVAMDDFVHDAFRQVGRLASGDRRDDVGAGPDETLGEDLSIGAGELDGFVDAEAPLDSGDTGGKQRPAALAEGATGTVVDGDGPSGVDGEGDPQLAGGEPAVAGQDDGADTCLAGHGGAKDTGPVCAGDDDTDAGPGRDLGGRDLRRHAAAAADGPRATRHRLEGLIDLDDLLDQRRRRVEAGVGGEKPRRIGQHHEH
jgi:hypothetical protein